MKNWRFLLLALGLLLMRCFSSSGGDYVWAEQVQVATPAPLTPQELASTKAWLYTLTPGEALTNIAYLRRLEGKESISFPTTLYALSEKGTLVIWWDSPLMVKLGDRVDKYMLPKIEKKDFIQLKQNSLGWVVPGAIGLGSGLIVGAILTAVFIH